MKKRNRVIISAILAIILFAFGFYYIFFLRLVIVPTGSMKELSSDGEGSYSVM